MKQHTGFDGPLGTCSRSSWLKRVGAAAFFSQCGFPLQAAQIEGRAKAVIEIWMSGGPCHIDTFDPKPEAGRDYCGPFTKAIPTNVDGIRLNQSLPMLAKQADKYSLIRSMTHGINAHETAEYMMQTGRKSGAGQVFPSVGAVVSMFKGYDNGYKGLIPPFIALTKGKGRFSESGFLGPRYKPFVTGSDPSKEVFAVSGVITPGITKERQQNRRDLLHKLDTLGSELPDHPLFNKLDKCEDTAYELILGDAAKVFDLALEPAPLREKYGMNKFGQSCLAARRLIEQGVKYVSINAGGWDTHKQHFNSMGQMLPNFDRGLATLLEDLSQRGLLDSTVVWCSGEFGRTPRVQWAEPWNGGRSHFGHCFSAMVAGGGFAGGHVVGASNATGEEVAERPVYPQDLIGSVYELMGIDPDGPLPNQRGLDVPVVPKSQGQGRLKEIMNV